MDAAIPQYLVEYSMVWKTLLFRISKVAVVWELYQTYRLLEKTKCLWIHTDTEYIAHPSLQMAWQSL